MFCRWSEIFEIGSLLTRILFNLIVELQIYFCTLSFGLGPVALDNGLALTAAIWDVSAAIPPVSCFNPQNYSALIGYVPDLVQAIRANYPIDSTKSRFLSRVFHLSV
jgi:hypothetical protein